MQEDIAVIFCKADKDKSGTLALQEFQEVVDDICERYPQVEIYLKKKQMKNFAALLKKTQSDAQKQSTELDIESFKSLLSEVDSQMKNLPATAQVNTYILIILACKNFYSSAASTTVSFSHFRLSEFCRLLLNKVNILQAASTGWSSVKSTLKALSDFEGWDATGFTLSGKNHKDQIK